ncbi:hypothetical protein [Arsenicicoccus dermatophilus]|uniref:hypothetical protein n=1 Tax=Arsenicicoccus dermatophilus TaxID=1076331 RepID=UPI001F4C7256|nr:hypothetical protein [Arsenicicoccus dermatophilus]MCH8614398.1 hypothetical protein [Arsenicicoccus dermatophilus]
MGRGSAFIDESTQGNYLVVCSVVPSPSITDARRQMRGLLRPGQRSLHMKSESRSSQDKIVRTIRDLGLAATIYLADPHMHGGHVQARDACLRRAAADAVEKQLDRIVLDHIESMVARDRKSIVTGARQAGADTVPFRYDHLRRHAEPLLWIPDAVGWLYQRGSEQRRSVENLITVIPV